MVHERFVPLEPWYINIVERMGGNSRRGLFVIKSPPFDIAPRWAQFWDRIILFNDVSRVCEAIAGHACFPAETRETNVLPNIRRYQRQSAAECHGPLAMRDNMNVPTAAAVSLGCCCRRLYLSNHAQFGDCNREQSFVEENLDIVAHSLAAYAPAGGIVDHPGVWNTLESGKLVHPHVESRVIIAIVIYARRSNQKLALGAREGRKVVFLAEGVAIQYAADQAKYHSDGNGGIGHW